MYVHMYLCFYTMYVYVNLNCFSVLDVMEAFLMKKKQAHMMSILTLPDPSLHYSLELK